MSEHTPGNWRVGDAGHSVFGPKTNAVSPEIIATMGKHNFRENAALIAAAPIMYEALEDIANGVNSCHTDAEWIAKLQKRAQSAIFMAEGRLS